MAGLSLVTLLSALGGIWHFQANIAQAAIAASPMVASQPTKAAAIVPTGTTAPNQHQSVTNTTTASTNNTPSHQSASADANSPAPASTNAQAPVMATISLSVNGIHKGSVTLSTTSNQCNVLSQALNNGFISNLVMPYDSAQKTYGVYVIDGLGDPSSVWWTYTVNGRPPPLGCSYITVHNGDSVNWQYK